MNALLAQFQKETSTSLTLIHVSVAAPALALARTMLSLKTNHLNKSCALKMKKACENRFFSFFSHFT
jgi:hypothetical protein